MFPGFNPFGIGYNPIMSPLQQGSFQGAEQPSGLSYDPGTAYFQPEESANLSQGAWAQTPLGATMTAYYKLKDMQQRHGIEQGQWLESAKNDVDIKKQQVFEENHYQLDDQGKLMFGENGHPLLDKGAENADQKKVRLDWEKSEQDRLTASYSQQSKEVTAKLQKYQMELQANPYLMYDPKYRDEYVSKFAEVKGQSELLDKQYFNDLTRSGLDFLPNPDDPEGTMGGHLDKLGGDFAALQQRHQAEEAGSPEGQLLAKLSQQYTDYLGLLYPTTMMA